jgi:hypothetical protein
MPGSLTTLGNRCAPVVMFLDLILRVAVYDTVTLTYLRSVGSRNVGVPKPKISVSSATSKIHPINQSQISDRINVTKKIKISRYPNHRSKAYNQSIQSIYIMTFEGMFICSGQRLSLMDVQELNMPAHY